MHARQEEATAGPAQPAASLPDGKLSASAVLAMEWCGSNNSLMSSPLDTFHLVIDHRSLDSLHRCVLVSDRARSQSSSLHWNCRPPDRDEAWHLTRCVIKVIRAETGTPLAAAALDRSPPPPLTLPAAARPRRQQLLLQEQRDSCPAAPITAARGAAPPAAAPLHCSGPGSPSPQQWRSTPRHGPSWLGSSLPQPCSATSKR